MQDQFKNTYFEECDDRIQEAEEGLSLMMEGARDTDTINLVFRAIHSIKGGAGAFAFNDVVDFSHEFETVLDYVREGKLTPDRDMCNLFLRANDIVAEMINTVRNNNEIQSNFGNDILTDLRAIVSSLNGTSSAQNNESQDSQQQTKSMCEWEITFAPHPEMLQTGNDPVYLIKSLAELGEIDVTSNIENIPSLDQIDPETCYTQWAIKLTTDEDESEITEVFDFVDDLCDLNIAKIKEINPKPVQAAPATTSSDQPAPTTSGTSTSPSENSAPQKTVSTSIRVDLERIDHLVNLVGEMVIAQSMLQERIKWLPMEIGNDIGEDVENLTRHMRDLQESVMSVRAQPIKSVFSRMPRTIREACSAVGKDVRLETIGEDTEVDKTVLENLIDPLTHMIRNSVDHGIEKPEDRIAAGKESHGTIVLSAKHKSGRIIIEIKDNGKGIDRQAVLAKAEKQNLIQPDANLTPNEIDNLVFKPGFSTAEALSELSGRGVGMDVVRRNVVNLGGRITISSEPGQGCVLTLSLPLTLAVMDGMVVSVGSRRFVLPTINIVESFQPKNQAIGQLTNDVNVIEARGQYVRLLPLYDMFQINDAVTTPEEGLVILLETDDGEKVAVMVDDVLGQQQVVIKSLDTNYTTVGGISAATILGNGEVALILDVPSLKLMKVNINLADNAKNAPLTQTNAIEEVTSIPLVEEKELINDSH